MRRGIWILAVLAALAGGVLIYSKGMAQAGSGAPPALVAAKQRADAVIVDKPARELMLLRQGKVIRRYDISLGAAPDGHKQQEGDERTPEGDYVIDWRNENSIAHLSCIFLIPMLQTRHRLRPGV
ncbi:L,D-transpeptidase family protein [Alisedimentitalea sp. MJ-SS2]|uniref:L,D-transpeptidase family protein n=1 Tax=Aliisedimentitalea sp. MJ-SS2 TaxID=3049795 RepID=UPI002915136E|nr:L,D-transpeptidase family protein [Alisedimentitalea sp. MJ-SS2]MDU8926006.1 L,D-transpeptidase family protein [Alisedimentitalea sp. MJ-SS2]